VILRILDGILILALNHPLVNTVNLRSELLTAVKMPVLVFWFVTPCGLAGSPEDGDSMFI
jgi:hypothetical protein